MDGQSEALYGDNGRDRSEADVEDRERPEGSGPETAAEDRGDVRSRGSDADGGQAVERPGNTQLLTSHSSTNPLPPSPLSSPSSNSNSPQFIPLPNGLFLSVNLDWLETAGCVVWDGSGEELFFRLAEVVDDAKAVKHKVPYALNGHSLFVHPSGLGSGRQARLPYRLEWCGVTIAFAERESDRRQMNNFYLNVPGEACLLHGAEWCREQVQGMLATLGGTLTDEWCRRIDLCVDVVHLDLREELLPCFLAEQFVTTAVKWNPWSGKQGPTGFTVGRGGRVVLNVYDKLLEVSQKHQGPYCQAMIERRWMGKLPQAATRIEYQIKKEWLDSYGFRSVDQVLGDVADIVGKLTDEDMRPYFRMTATAVDREHNHQSRAATLPLWGSLVAGMKQGVGVASRELKPIQRGSMSLTRIYGMLRGYLTKAAALMGVACTGVEDGVEVLRKLHQLNEGLDAEWERLWETKAREAGTLDSVMSFRPGLDF